MSEIVVATTTMPREDMLRANLFSMIVQACHHMGLTKYIAIYLFRSKGVPYEDFYEALMERLADKNRYFSAMRAVYAAYLRGEGEMSCVDRRFGGITWFPEELFFLQNLAELDDFYSDILPVVESFTGDPLLAEQLVRFQSLFAVVPQAKKRQIRLSYDFYHYFYGDMAEPEQKEIRISVLPPCYPNWPDCARRTVWYGRRRSMTDAFVCSSELEIG